MSSHPLSPAMSAELRAGMMNPVPRRLIPPLRLCRFTDRARGPNEGLLSPWWIDENDLQKIFDKRSRSREEHAGGANLALSLGFVARMSLAVPQEWQGPGHQAHRTTMDLLLRADLRASIDAFVGRGRPQREVSPRGITLRWVPLGDIAQIYIPELSGRQDPKPTLADVTAVMAVGAPSYFVSRSIYE